MIPDVSALAGQLGGQRKKPQADGGATGPAGILYDRRPRPHKSASQTLSHAVDFGPTSGEAASQYGWTTSNTTTPANTSGTTFVPELQAGCLIVEQLETGAGLASDDLHFT
jgi:hypothetical protein